MPVPLIKKPLQDFDLWRYIAHKINNLEVVSTTPTTDSLNPGESILFDDGVNRILYVNVDDNILGIAFGSGSSVSPGSGKIIIDADGDTKVDVEESSDEDIIRFDTNGTQRMLIDATGLILAGLNSTDLSLTTGSIVSVASLNAVTAETNASLIAMSAIAGSFIAFTSSKTGSGTVLPIVFFVSGEKLRITEDAVIIDTDAGVQGKGVEYKNDQVSTATTSATTIASITLAVNEIITIEYTITGVNDGDEVVIFRRVAKFENLGTLSQLGSTETVGSDVDQPTANSTGISISDPVVNIQITPESIDPYVWAINYKIHRFISTF